MKSSLLYLCFIISGHIYSQKSIDQNLIGYFNFDENLVDTSGFNGNIVENGKIEFVEDANGNSGSSAYFDGIDDYVAINPSNSFSFGNNQSFSISVMAKPEQMNYVCNQVQQNPFGYVFSKYGCPIDGSGDAIYLRIGQNLADFVVRTSGGYIKRLALLDTFEFGNGFNHFLVERNPKWLKFYINTNIIDSTEFLTNDEISASLPVYIGRGMSCGPPDNGKTCAPFKGFIDDFRFYNKSLTKTEIKEIYSNYFSPKVIELPIDSLFINELITPNNDGKNDLFEIKNINRFRENEVIIFDKFGKIIFQKKNYDNTWSGEGFASGLYFYQFQANEGKISKSGNIFVTR